MVIEFDFGAAGYVEASEIRIIEVGQRATRRFALDDSGKIPFMPSEKGGSTAEVTIKMVSEDETPETVDGTYCAGGKIISFWLTKK